jgi:hypothetical protein
MTVKKITSLCLTLLLIFSSVGYCAMFSKNKTRFDWLTSASAPSNYPMKIISGTFYYHDEKGGLYIPDASSISPGWGAGSGVHAVGEDFKALPDRLDIRFFSYTENKMYQGSFELPYEKILALFRAGVAKDKDTPTFQKLIAGIAPGGTVAVWVSGLESREVFFGKAVAYDGIFTNSLNQPVDDVEDYCMGVLKQSLTPEFIADMRKNGIPLDIWARYRKQYHWQPTFVQAQRPKYVTTRFHNGERYKINFPLEEAITKRTQSVPMHISFAYLIAGETMPDFYTVYLDEAETFAVFEKLGTSEIIYIESDPKLPKELTTVRIFNSKESIVLKKCRTEK